MYFDNFHKHQNKCMPFILQSWVSFHIALKTTNLQSFTNNYYVRILKTNIPQDLDFQGYVGQLHENHGNWSLENFQLYDSD